MNIMILTMMQLWQLGQVELTQTLKTLQGSYDQAIAILQKIESKDTDKVIDLTIERSAMAGVKSQVIKTRRVIREERDKLQVQAKEKFDSTYDTIDSQFDRRVLLEYQRLSNNKSTINSIKGSFPIDQFDRRGIRKAQSDLVVIGLSVQIFRAIHPMNQHPNNLADLSVPLTKNSKPLLSVEKLTDPWGRRYQYDAGGVRNQGKNPDVWSLGPLHGSASGMDIIGNW